MCDVAIDSTTSSISGPCQVPRENAALQVIQRAYFNWQRARVHKQLLQQLDDRSLADISLTRFPTVLDKVSDVAVKLLGAPTFRENDQC